MDQVPNRANVPADPRAMVVDPRIAEKRVVQEHRSKKSDELVTVDNQLFGLDKNLLITFAVVGVSLMFSMYLFREVKKLRDDVRDIKAQEPDQELADKVEENSEAVKAIETKLDQLINALGARERRMQQMAQQLQQIPQQGQQMGQQVTQQMMPPPQQAQQMTQPQMMQPPPVMEQEYQNQQIMQQQMAQQQAQQQQMEAQQMAQQSPQMVMSQPQIPVMGGRLAGSAVTVDDPGIIRI